MKVFSCYCSIWIHPKLQCLWNASSHARLHAMPYIFHTSECLNHDKKRHTSNPYNGEDQHPARSTEQQLRGRPSSLKSPPVSIREEDSNRKQMEGHVMIEPQREGANKGAEGEGDSG